MEILKKLITWIEPQELKISLLQSKDFSAFIYAADKGYLDIIQFIWESIPHSLQLDALTASNYAAYRLATKNHYFHITNFLETKTNEETILKMKKAVRQGITPPK